MAWLDARRRHDTSVLRQGKMFSVKSKPTLNKDDATRQSKASQRREHPSAPRLDRESEGSPSPDEEVQCIHHLPSGPRTM